MTHILSRSRPRQGRRLTFSLVLVHDQGDDGALGPVLAVHILAQVTEGAHGHRHEHLVQVTPKNI